MQCRPGRSGGLGSSSSAIVRVDATLLVKISEQAELLQEKRLVEMVDEFDRARARAGVDERVGESLRNCARRLHKLDGYGVVIAARIRAGSRPLTPVGPSPRGATA